jgi:hypothetical protein
VLAFVEYPATHTLDAVCLLAMPVAITVSESDGLSIESTLIEMCHDVGREPVD